MSGRACRGRQGLCSPTGPRWRAISGGPAPPWCFLGAFAPWGAKSGRCLPHAGSTCGSTTTVCQMTLLALRPLMDGAAAAAHRLRIDSRQLARRNHSHVPRALHADNLIWARRGSPSQAAQHISYQVSCQIEVPAACPGGCQAARPHLQAVLLHVLAHVKTAGKHRPLRAPNAAKSAQQAPGRRKPTESCPPTGGRWSIASLPLPHRQHLPGMAMARPVLFTRGSICSLRAVDTFEPARESVCVCVCVCVVPRKPIFRSVKADSLDAVQQVYWGVMG